jgi:small subunit ribosomal protein S16
MATKIRLQRGGAKKRPFYRVVIADSRAPRDGKFIEKVGTFNPLVSKDNESRLVIQKERVEYWLANGAVPSEKVALLIDSLGIGKDNTSMKEIFKKRNKTIELKKVEIEAKKKAEEEKRKAEEEAKKKEEEEAAAAAKAAESEEAPSEENTSDDSTAADESAEEESKSE